MAAEYQQSVEDIVAAQGTDAVRGLTSGIRDLHAG